LDCKAGYGIAAINKKKAGYGIVGINISKSEPGLPK
jgi:hypothetical protein